MRSNISYLVVLFFTGLCESLNVSEVINNNVTKREANAKADPEINTNFYPEWVPFKKNIEEIGELIPVKQTPKKRLALPVNYVLKAAAETAEVPEYVEVFDNAAEDDNEDEYEKKEWSDLHRVVDEKTHPQKEVERATVRNQATTAKVNHRRSSEEKEEIDEPEKDVEEIKTRDNVSEEKKPSLKESEEKKSVEKESEERKSNEKESEEVELTEEEKEERRKQEEEEKARAQAQKEKVLGEVDQLKEKHAQEQRLINEKSRNEDVDLKFLANSEKQFNKYRKHSRKHYDDYGEPLENIYDKYAIHTPPKTKFSTIIDVTTQRSSRKGNRRRKFKKVNKDNNKQSVYKVPKFGNSNDFTASDDVSSSKETPSYINHATKSTRPTTAVEKTEVTELYTPRYQYDPIRIAVKLNPTKSETYTNAPTSETEIYSTKINPTKDTESYNTEFVSTGSDSDSTRTETSIYTTPEIPTQRNTEENVKILFVPRSTTRPKSFYSQKRRLNRRRKQRVKSTPAPDAFVAETIEDKASTAAGAETTIQEVLPTALEAASATDAVAAPSEDHKKEGGGNHEHKRAGGKEHHSEQHSDHEEHGKKAYEAHHETKKTAEGHHDKEDHKGTYNDEGGHDKFHHKEDNHYGSHHHEEAGKKHAKYEESGKHSKGHSTKGSHNIHKKDEYEKKVEFFEEDGDSGEEEKHGGYEQEKEHASGGHYKKGAYKAAHKDHAKGQEGHFAKGGHLEVHKGHKKAAGYDSHGKQGHGHHHKEHGEAGKKWIYHHGYPAKTANLVVIDRRLDRFKRGPAIFG